ncbi:MAG: hypothetical protein BME93_06005 [Methanosarcinales archaeon Met12]|nr:MAG: hypothetical protein BME93_06005 [Methanosarcinales archaeon Met12]
MYKISLARHCTDDPDKYIAESSFSRPFFMKKLCQLLKKRVANLKCAEDLGVAKFEIDGKTVMIYRNGRIDIRSVKNVADAEAIMEKTERLVATAYDWSGELSPNIKRA